MKKCVDFIKNEEGATAIEYALILTFIALVIIVSLKALGFTLSNVFQTLANTFNAR